MCEYVSNALYSHFPSTQTNSAWSGQQYAILFTVVSSVRLPENGLGSIDLTIIMYHYHRR